MILETLKIPVSLILEMHAQLDAATQEKLEDFIRDYKKTIDPKEHVAEGFRKDETGALIFDKGLFREAWKRGKVETYAGSARQHLEGLKSAMSTLRTMVDSHSQAALAVDPSTLSQRIGQGKSLSDEDARLFADVERLLLEEKPKRVRQGRKPRALSAPPQD